MAIHFLHTGGGPIGRDHINRASGSYFPSIPTKCCNVTLPEAALYYDPKYVFDFSPKRQEAIGCYLAKKTLAAGDKLVGSMIGAGAIVDTVTVQNHHGCAGWAYHFELHDVRALVVEAEGGAASVGEVVFANIDGAAAKQVAYDVSSANDNVPYFGDPYGTVVEGGKTLCCKKHKALVLVIDTLPTAGAEPVSPCPTQVCNFQNGEIGCDAVGQLDCVSLTASVHVSIPNGVRNT